MSEAAERVPGAMGCVVVVPGQSRAWARWKARQAEIYAGRTRARMMLSVLRQFNEDMGGRFSDLTLAELCRALADLAAEVGGP